MIENPLMRVEAALSRRVVLALAACGLAHQRLQPVTAADDSNPLWPREGLFPDCPRSDTCVSSQDDRPQSWDNPWVFDGAAKDAHSALSRRVTSKKLGGRIVASDGERYLRVEFDDKTPFGATVTDDAEFFFAPDDTLVQFRSARRGEANTDFSQNRNRLEKLRMGLGWEKVPVLRNRRRALVVVESPFDNFGPALYSEQYTDTDPAASPFKPPTKLERAWLRESDDRVRSK